MYRSFLYDVPSRTGVTIAPETYAELSKHPNINGVKEAGGNLGAHSKNQKPVSGGLFHLVGQR